MQRHPWTVALLVLACLVLVLFAAHERDPGSAPAHTPAVSHP